MEVKVCVCKFNPPIWMDDDVLCIYCGKGLCAHCCQRNYYKGGLACAKCFRANCNDSRSDEWYNQREMDGF